MDDKDAEIKRLNEINNRRSIELKALKQTIQTLEVDRNNALAISRKSHEMWERSDKENAALRLENANLRVLLKSERDAGRRDALAVYRTGGIEDAWQEG